MAIPGLPGGFFSSTRETHLFPLKGRLCLAAGFPKTLLPPPMPPGPSNEEPGLRGHLKQPTLRAQNASVRGWFGVAWAIGCWVVLGCAVCLLGELGKVFGWPWVSLR